MPTEPAASRWDLSAANATPGEDLVGVGADLEPGTVLGAYRMGLFPMGLGGPDSEPMGWWAPDPRGVMLPGDLHVSRSLARSARGFEVTSDQSFVAVVAGCADPSRSGGWITPRIAGAYTRLHLLGWAHSVEVWRGGLLVGGLYGLAIGRLFAGESMFHRATDASKVAVLALVDILGEDGVPWLLDVQWQTPHLASLGVREIGRDRYLRLLRDVVSEDLPQRWRGSSGQGPTHVTESSGDDGSV